MVEHVEGGTIDWEWDGSLSDSKLFRCTCTCGKVDYHTKGNIKRRLRKGRWVCKMCKFHQSAINTAWSKHIEGARSRNIFQGLTKEEWYDLSRDNCFYCGLEPSTITKSQSGHAQFVRNGIDRIHNGVGYTVDNCVACCFECNSSKSIRTQKEFIEMCNRVARLHPR